MKKINFNDKRVLLVAGLAFIILGILLIAFISDKATDNSAYYGTRLDGIDKVKITKSKKEKITKALKDTGKTKSEEVSVQGKIINVLVKVKKDISRDDAKTLSNVVLENLKDEEKKFYDVQIFISKDKDKQFPIIGYKHHNKDGFSWTLDR